MNEPKMSSSINHEIQTILQLYNITHSYENPIYSQCNLFCFNTRWRQLVMISINVQLAKLEV